MYRLLSFIFSFLLVIACQNRTTSEQGKPAPSTKTLTEFQSSINNSVLKNHPFLDCMYSDPYFPTSLVDVCQMILIQLCKHMDRYKNPKREHFMMHAHHAVEEINALQNDFYAQDSEIETVARECLARDFELIAKQYDQVIPVEEIISNREW